MRNAFAAQITELAESDPRIVLLSGDIGNRLFNDYKARAPDRFFNCGVAEANMTSMAAGMALCGLRPVTYTIAPFATTRCFEQIRVDVCYHNVPVVIVGVGAGLSYAGLGATHHACEDISLLRSLPNMTVVCPGDVWEVRAALQAALGQDGPVYLRLGKKNEPVIHEGLPDFAIGRGIVIREGADACLLSTGTTLPVAVRAGELLTSQGIATEVVSMHTVKPLDDELLQRVFAECTVVATVEEHSLLGGLGGAVAEWLTNRSGTPTPLLRFATPDAFTHEAGDQAHFREQFGLTPDNISTRVQESFAKNPQSL